MVNSSAVVFGDWHHDADFAIQALLRADTLVHSHVPFIHVGDFGLFAHPRYAFNGNNPDINNIMERHLTLGERHKAITDVSPFGFLAEVDIYLRRLGRLLYVVPGNHENYWELSNELGFYGMIGAKDQAGTSPRPMLTWGTDARDIDAGHVDRDHDGFIVSPLFTNIRLIPRTHIWTWSGVTYGSLGGACSIDKDFRTMGYDWWPEEVPTAEQVATLENEKVDVFISHDGPITAVNKLYESNRAPLPASLQKWLDTSSTAVEQARAYTSPSLLIHGHHHVRYSVQVENTTVHGLSANVTGGSVDDNFFIVPERVK